MIEGFEINWLEVIATIAGLACVWLCVKRSIWCWPTGLISVTIYTFIFYDARLYSDVILHIFYILMNIYGWYHWLYGGGGDNDLPVTSLRRFTFLWSGIIVLGTIAWGLTMREYTDASLPFADAFTTVASLVAQWMMARKKLESWVFWIIVDIVATGVYWYKGLYITSGLYAVYLVMASIGLFEWLKEWRNNNTMSVA